MARPDDCPGTERLAAWLAGSVPEDLAVHVEGCPACRQEVERRLSASEVLGGLTPGASDSQRRRGPALRNALDSLKRESLEVPDPTEQAPSVVGRSTVAGPSQSVRVPRPGDESSPRMTEVGPAKPDRRIGPYQVLDRVGRGGMGEVFRAMDPALDRVVAVKVLTESLAGSPEARRRFLREARAAAAVCHEHVVTIHAVDDSGDQPYLVMQYVAGDSLQEKIDRQGPLGLKEILRIGMQVASGLAAAHAQGLIHRDVKPANILLENGVERVKITDFGLARASSDPNLTRSGTIVGTPNYMSPEQARGESVSPRSDLFSLGGVLYAMATGEPPFVADSAMAVLRKVCEDPPRPIHEVNPEAPEWLVTLVDRLMAKQREGRPSSAEEVAEVLRRHLAELQSVPKVEPEPSRTNRRGKAIRTALALVLALVSVAAAGAVAVNLEFWTASSTPLPEPGPVAVSTLDSPTPEQADPFVEEGTEAARRNDHREAIDLFGKALQIDPGSVVARIGRGRAYGRLEDWSKALADLDQAIRQDPRNADAHEERAYLRTRSGDFSGAIADANVTLRLDPGRTHAYAHRGVALYGLDQWARSLSDLDTFIRLIPDEPWSHFHRANTRSKLGDQDGALEDIDRAIRLMPGNPHFHFRRAGTLLLKGEIAQAMIEAETTLRLDPRNPGNLRFRGWLHVLSGDYAKALIDYRAALQDVPLDLVQRADLASIEGLTGDYQASEANFQKALEMDPTNAWVRARRGYYLHGTRGDHARAVVDFDEALRLSPGLGEAHYWRGLSRLAKGDAAGACDDFDAALHPSQNDGMTFEGPFWFRHPEIRRARDEARSKASK